ncbi:DddA-like double-stranded DNA deaminase toxin [Saccharothrix lopnurensis]|uniref:DddA-like double-stranded DNA deaminase toxin n=1 Tax=Saccharothrix lopnurensis TaxID=1670621 RepID=A0ABW1NWX4_9PSEU
MALTREVAAQVRAACAKGEQARTALEQAEDLAQEAHDMLARAWEGARRFEADGARVLSALAGVADACKGHYWPLLNEAVKAARGYANHLATGIPDPTPTPQRPAPPPTQPPPTDESEPNDPPAIPPERIEQLRRELPPPVVSNTGQKTHGWWIGPDGQAQKVVSERDERSALVQQQLAKKGLHRRITRAGDVEIKVAADMAENGIKNATVVINYVPCKGPLGCDTLVPVLLPEGATLTVHGITEAGVRTRTRYTGGAQPWWT